MVTTEAEAADTSAIQVKNPVMENGPSMVVENVTSSTKRISDNRRSNKPIMEKRRRARINNCLNELKTLILDAMKKDPARHSKLEKADILEMTVKHLQSLQRQQIAMSAATDPANINKYRAGFSECATEVGRFPGLDPLVKRRLLQHLATCLNQSTRSAEPLPQIPQVQVHILPTTAKMEPQQTMVPKTGGIILSNGNGTGLQLVPTRLPNGDIALVLPSHAGSQQHQVADTTTATRIPLLVPIVPERTSSTGSATSSSNYSPSHSPEPGVGFYHQSKPLSLVVRKPVMEQDGGDGEKPWRPW